MSQANSLLALLQDGKPHSTVEIQKVVYGGEHLGTARIASRVTDLRDRGYEIESRPGRINKKVWYYLLRSSPEQPEKVVRRYEPIIKDGVRMMREVTDTRQSTA